MKTHRGLRVSSVMREELGKLFLRELDFGQAIVTITDIEIDSKMIWADVFVSVIPGNKADDVLQTLRRSTSHLHHLLNRKLNIRPMPGIRFRLDHGLENAARIEKDLMEDNNK